MRTDEKAKGEFMIGSATFSEDGMYRYHLMREWDQKLDKICFVMLNPSLADGMHTDNTIRRCINFAKSWGYGGIEVVNLFAFITPYPEELYQAADPIGPANLRYLKQVTKSSKQIVAAWGNLGVLEKLAHEKIDFTALGKLMCIKVNKTGEPAHPLYLSAKLKPKSYDLKIAA